MKRSVNVVIEDDKNRVLVLRRDLNDDIYPGFWDLPGGGIKENETPQEGAEREVLEETGLRVKLEEDYFETKTYSDGEVNYVFKAKLVDGDVAVSNEHSESRWVSKDDWEGLEYTSDVKNILEKVFNSKGNSTKIP